MGRKRNNGLSEEKRNIIGQLIEMYDVKTAADIQEALKDLLISSQERDGNKRCGGTLYTLFQNALYRVTLNPFIGQPTEAENIRYIIPHPDYTLLYRHSLRKIEVLVLWNNHHKLGSMINIIREEPDTE